MSTPRGGGAAARPPFQLGAKNGVLDIRMEKRKRGAVTILGFCYGNVKALTLLLRTAFSCTCEILDSDGAVTGGPTEASGGAKNSDVAYSITLMVGDVRVGLELWLWNAYAPGGSKARAAGVVAQKDIEQQGDTSVFRGVRKLSNLTKASSEFQLMQTAEAAAASSSSNNTNAGGARNVANRNIAAKNATAASTSSSSSTFNNVNVPGPRVGRDGVISMVTSTAATKEYDAMLAGTTSKRKPTYNHPMQAAPCWVWHGYWPYCTGNCVKDDDLDLFHCLEASDQEGEAGIVTERGRRGRGGSTSPLSSDSEHDDEEDQRFRQDAAPASGPARFDTPAGEEAFRELGLCADLNKEAVEEYRREMQEKIRSRRERQAVASGAGASSALRTGPERQKREAYLKQLLAERQRKLENAEERHVCPTCGHVFGLRKTLLLHQKDGGCIAVPGRASSSSFAQRPRAVAPRKQMNRDQNRKKAAATDVLSRNLLQKSANGYGGPQAVKQFRLAPAGDETAATHKTITTAGASCTSTSSPRRQEGAGAALWASPSSKSVKLCDGGKEWPHLGGAFSAPGDSLSGANGDRFLSAAILNEGPKLSKRRQKQLGAKPQVFRLAEGIDDVYVDADGQPLDMDSELVQQAILLVVETGKQIPILPPTPTGCVLKNSAREDEEEDYEEQESYKQQLARALLESAADAGFSPPDCLGLAEDSEENEANPFDASASPSHLVATRQRSSWDEERLREHEANRFDEPPPSTFQTRHDDDTTRSCLSATRLREHDGISRLIDVEEPFVSATLSVSTASARGQAGHDPTDRLQEHESNRCDDVFVPHLSSSGSVSRQRSPKLTATRAFEARQRTRSRDDATAKSATAPPDDEDWQFRAALAESLKEDAARQRGANRYAEKEDEELRLAIAASKAAERRDREDRFLAEIVREHQHAGVQLQQGSTSEDVPVEVLLDSLALAASSGLRSDEILGADSLSPSDIDLATMLDGASDETVDLVIAMLERQLQ